jgi:WD40 repeat protein
MEFALSSPPVDGVSRVRWLDANYLLVSSWDGSVSVHEVGQHASRRVGQYSHQGPVLDVTVGEPGCGVSLSGGLDMAVLRHDFETGVSDVLGSHTGAVKCVEYNAARGMVLTGSWDKSVRVWDARSGGGGANRGRWGGGNSLASLPLPDPC